MLFSQPLFTRYELPKQWRAGGAAAYWIPLIGLFTGARISELAQLRPEDVSTSGLIPHLGITDAGDGQQVKTSASVRSMGLVKIGKAVGCGTSVVQRVLREAEPVA